MVLMSCTTVTLLDVEHAPVVVRGLTVPLRSVDAGAVGGEVTSHEL